MDIISRITAHRAKEEELAWEGTFADYLELVRDHPIIAQPAHSRIYQMIESAGFEKDENGHNVYRFFSQELFGLTEPIDRLVEEYFHSAAKRLDVRKRILLLMGPVSGGKSTIVTLLKEGLERFSRTQEGALYGIKGCPMHEEPYTSLCNLFESQ